MTTSLIHRGSAALLLLLAVLPLSAAPKKPAKPAPRKPVRRVPRPAMPPAKGADWGGGPLRVAIDHRTGVTFGPQGCPVAVLGANVWDLKEKKVVGKLAGAYEPRGLRALSPDGRWFAAALKTPNQEETAVGVWSTETGKKVMEVPSRKEVYVDLVALRGEKNLLVGGRHSNRIEVWDVEAKIMTATFPIADRRVEGDKLAISHDGRYVACIAHDKIVVSEVESGNPVAALAPPGPPRADLLQPGDTPPGERRASSVDAVFVYAWTNSLAFSPDGKELAAFSTHPYPRLLCWNARGQLVLDEPVAMPPLVTSKWSLEWLPDRTGWLVNGYLFDRNSKRVVANFKTPFAAEVLPHLLDRDRVAGVFGAEEGTLKVVEIPWTRLYASLEQMRSGAAAFISPVQPVSLMVDIAGARGDVVEAQRMLWGALSRRLARDGIGISGSQPSILRLRLAEQAGDTLPIYERQSPFDFRGRDTGRRATEAKGAAVLELWAAGERTPLWRGVLNASSSRSFQEEITDASLRKSMLEHLTRQLNGMDLPYFIPRSREHVALPAVIE